MAQFGQPAAAGGEAAESAQRAKKKEGWGRSPLVGRVVGFAFRTPAGPAASRGFVRYAQTIATFGLRRLHQRPPAAIEAGGDVHGFAVFGDGAAGQFEAFLAQDFDELVV